MKYSITYRYYCLNTGRYEDLEEEAVKRLKLKDNFKTIKSAAKAAVEAVNRLSKYDVVAEIWNIEEDIDLIEVDTNYTVEEVIEECK